MERLTKKANDVYYALSEDLSSDGNICTGKAVE